MTRLALAVLLAAVCAAGWPRAAGWLRRFAASRGRRALLWALVAIPAGVAAILEGGGSPALVCGFLAPGIVAFVWLDAGKRPGGRPGWGEWLVLLAIWPPIELGWRAAVASGGLGLAVTGTTLAAALLIVVFTAVRPRFGEALRWRLKGGDVAACFVVIAAIALYELLPFTATDFVPRSPAGAAGLPAVGLWALLGCALPGEVVHRGLVFGFLQRTFTSRHGPVPALVLSAVVFGFDAVLRWGDWSWSLFLLAVWAGICLGWSYLRTGSLLPGIVAHAVLGFLGSLA